MIHPLPIIEFYLPKDNKQIIFDFRFEEMRALHRLEKITKEQLLDYEHNFSDTFTHECNYIITLKEIKENENK
jgi:hypothetical protein